MQRGKPALVSVFLSFVCMITASSKFCSKDLVAGINHLHQEAPNKKSLNCSLYTPTTEDYKKCPSTAMKCFASEMEVLVNEWEAGRAGQSLKKRLSRLAMSFDQMGSECRQCELMREENATTFLKNLLSTLQRINNRHC